MTVTRLAISLDPALARDARRAAGKQPLSAWIADAVARRLRAEGLAGLVDEWEAEHGPLGSAELAAADWTRPKPKRRKR
jgi:hypothetical protein